MSSETISVARRTDIGSNASKRIRAKGQVPAILYGHGEESISLSVRADTIRAVINHGTKLLSLTGDVTDMAVLRQVQWDTFGVDVLHVDLHRVSASEAVEVTLPVKLHGEAPGIGEGGQLVFQTHELTIECPASSIPDAIEVNLTGLHLGQAIHAGEVVLPEGSTMTTPRSVVVVQIVKPIDTTDDEAGEGVEPELIRKEKPTKEAD